jgi:hypothetical protein
VDPVHSDQSRDGARNPHSTSSHCLSVYRNICSRLVQCQSRCADRHMCTAAVTYIHTRIKFSTSTSDESLVSDNITIADPFRRATCTAFSRLGLQVFRRIYSLLRPLMRRREEASRAIPSRHWFMICSDDARNPPILANCGVPTFQCRGFSYMLQRPIGSQ